MLKLKQVMAEAGLKQADLATLLGWSVPGTNVLLNSGAWPKRADKTHCKAQITAWLEAHGVRVKGVFAAVNTKVAGAGVAAPGRPGVAPEDGGHDGNALNEKDETMLRRKTMLTPAARRKWGFTLDPFLDPQSAGEVYLSAAAQDAYESIIAQAKAGAGLLAIIGESGAGKTTIKDLAVQYLLEHEPTVTLIQPYPQGMEPDDEKGKTMKAAHIAEAILRALTPDARPRASSEARFNQVHRALMASGGRHVLIIEEAHSLPTATLKHLKRFIELKAGLKSLLAVVLIGQPELAQRLSPRNLEVREVSQRCVDVPLPALTVPEIEAFLLHRLGRAEVFAADAYAALHRALQGYDGDGPRSFTYPLAVQNWAAEAMNRAAAIGAPTVTADLVDALVSARK